MPHDLTDADRANCLQASGYISFSDNGKEYAERIYRAGLAAGRERAIEECAKVCEAMDRRELNTPNDFADAIRALKPGAE